MINKLHFFLTYICDSLCDEEVPVYFLKEFPITTDNQTACIINPLLNDAHIRINLTQLELCINELNSRGFCVKYTTIEVLLHEIAHYKQYRKAMKKKKWFKAYHYRKDNQKRNEYHERVADRYAHYCLNFIKKDLKTWKNILDIS